MSDTKEAAYQHNLRGCALLRSKDLTGAIEAFGRAVELDPSAASYLSNLGLAKHRLGRKDDAICDLQEAIRLDPKYSPARAILGDVLHATGRYTEALESYRAALDLGDKDAEAIQAMMSKCRAELDRLSSRSQVVIQRGPFRTRMSEKQFLGCLLVWAVLIIVGYVVVVSTGISGGGNRLEGPVADYAEDMWRDAQRLVRLELSDAERVTFPQEPSYMPADEEAGKLELLSVVEYTNASHKTMRRRFRYEARYTADGGMHGGRVLFLEDDGE